MPTLTQREIEAQVAQIIMEELNLNHPVDQKERLIDDLGADSLHLVEIGMALEEKLGVEIDNEETENFKTVADITACVKKKLGA